MATRRTGAKPVKAETKVDGIVGGLVSVYQPALVVVCRMCRFPWQKYLLSAVFSHPRDGVWGEQRLTSVLHRARWLLRATRDDQALYPMWIGETRRLT